MFKSLFGAPEPDDVAWISRDARIKGIAAEAARLAQQGRGVLVVASTPADRDALASLPAPACAPSGIALQPVARGKPLDVLVCGRSEQRDADERLAAAARALHPDARVTFHVSLDDPLIRAFAANLAPLLQKLGMREDEPIRHAAVTRAIRNAQEKRSAPPGKV
jgi:preprotein translocase subunit SecA